MLTASSLGAGGVIDGSVCGTVVTGGTVTGGTSILVTTPNVEFIYERILLMRKIFW